jgi:hypothetical protein
MFDLLDAEKPRDVRAHSGIWDGVKLGIGLALGLPLGLFIWSTIVAIVFWALGYSIGPNENGFPTIIPPPK